MPVTKADLKAPKGEIEPAWFPAGDVDDRLDAYIADGEARAASVAESVRDAYVKAWAYHRAYKAVHMLLSGGPGEVKLDSGRTNYKYSPEQIAAFAARADYWFGIAEGTTGRRGSSVAVGRMKPTRLIC